MKRKTKRTFTEIRKILLKKLSRGPKSINDLSKASGVNWRTTENHLIHLMGKGHIKETFRSPYVRIFEITDRGREVLAGKE